MGAFTSEVMKRYAAPCWFPLSHAEAIQSHPDVSLTALSDINSEVLSRAMARYNVALGFSDYRRLIDEVSPEIVCIATRTPERPEIIEYAVGPAVRRGLHIEKPLCNGVVELQALERLLAPPSLVCTYGTLRRYFPIYQRARELAHSGRYGALRQIEVSFGSAQLLWTHPHSLDIMRFMAGDVEATWVSARFAAGEFTVNGARIDGDPIVLSAFVEFDTGVTGLISQRGGWDVTLTCSEGMISVEADGHRLRCVHVGGEDPYTFITELEPGSLDAERGGTRLALDRLASGLAGENPERVAADKRAIAEGQRLMFACAQSYLGGGIAVRPGQLDPNLYISGRSGSRFA